MSQRHDAKAALRDKLTAVENQRDDLQVQLEEIKTLLDCAIDHLLEVGAASERERKHLNTATNLACIAQRLLGGP